MADVFKDFLVVIESANGVCRGSLTPEESRASTRCPKTLFLADCIARYRAHLEAGTIFVALARLIRVAPSRRGRR